MTISPFTFGKNDSPVLSQRQSFLFFDREAAYILPFGTAITVDWLKQKAEEAEARCKAMPEQSSGDRYCDERLLMREVWENAEACALWMARSGAGVRSCVGPFSPSLNMRRDQVWIRPGSEIFSHHPDEKLRRVVSKRITQVVVEYSYRGYVERGNGSKPGADDVVQARVEWLGGGGYSRWTDANNVLTNSGD